MDAPLTTSPGPPTESTDAAQNARNSEAARLAELHDLAILDTPAEPQFERIMALAARHFGMPYGSITFVDRDRQWFKSAVGFGHREDPIADSICALAIRQPEVLVIEDASAVPATAHMGGVAGDPHIRFYAGASIRTDTGHALGTICVVDQQPRTFSDDDRRVLSDFAELVASELRLRRATRHLLAQSRTDELTGLLNRRGFLHGLKTALGGDRAHPLVLGLFDLNGFKRVNDTLGHAAGDAVLRHVAELTRALLHPGEVLARFGGDEFTLLIGGEGALDRADALTRALLGTFPDEHAPVSLSLGLVRVSPNPATQPSADELLSAADHAMYEAKGAGGGVVTRER